MKVITDGSWEGFNIWVGMRVYQVMYNKENNTISLDGKGPFIVKGVTNVPLKKKQ